MAKATTAKTKAVTIIARYYIKRLALICYSVRNGDNKTYCVTINPRKHTATCECEGNSVYHRQCYHITHCLEAEAARNASSRVQAQKAEATTPEAAPVVATPSAPVAAKATERTIERRYAAPLYRPAFSVLAQ